MIFVDQKKKKKKKTYRPVYRVAAQLKTCYIWGQKSMEDALCTFILIHTERGAACDQMLDSIISNYPVLIINI